MKKLVMIFALLSAALVSRAEKPTAAADFGRIRVSITNLCVQALRSEDVWNVGLRIKSRYGLSDAEMTDVLTGCLPMVEGRTDYEISHYRLFGLFERACGTNAIPVLAQTVRDNKSDEDVWFAYSAYCVIADMDESCFTLGSMILDSPSYGKWSRWAVYSRIGRRREKALKRGDQAFLQRSEVFYRSRQDKDADFRKHVGYRKWPGTKEQDGGSR